MSDMIKDKRGTSIDFFIILIHLPRALDTRHWIGIHFELPSLTQRCWMGLYDSGLLFTLFCVAVARNWNVARHWNVVLCEGKILIFEFGS